MPNSMKLMSVQRSPASKPLILAGFAIGCCIVSLISPALQPGFVPGSLGRSRTVSVSRADSANGDIPKWQKGLDTAYFNHEATPFERVHGLATYFTEIGTLGVAQKIITAITTVLEKGPDGAQETLDLLFPRGLSLRADIDAWLYLVEKAGPQRVITELEQLRTELELKGVKPPREIAELAETISERILPIGAEQASFSTSYVFRKLPQGKGENVDYIVIYNHKDFEVRVYQPFQAAKASIEGKQNSVTEVFASSVRGEKTSVGQAFTSMVEYVERQRGAVKVLMPIMTHYNKYEITPTGMSLPLQVPEDANVVSDSRVTYEKLPMQIVAVRKFLGIASDREVRDQYEILKNALIADGLYDVKDGDVKDGAYSLMQYNPPLTAPWRRNNEIGIHIKAPKQHMNLDRFIKPLQHKY